MAAAKGGAGKSRAATPKTLPAMTVARFRAALELMEAIVDENADLFIAKGQAYRVKRKAGTERELTAMEAASMAATAIGQHGVGEPEDLTEMAQMLQKSDLRQQEAAPETEVLLAAGVATAPAFFRAVARMVALVEMPADEFVAAYDADTLPQGIAEAARAFDHIDMADARPRAVAALEQFGKAAGQDSGKALETLGRTVLEGMKEAMTHMTESTSTLPTGWPASTDGAEPSVSTESDGTRPST